jgi:FKBP-type peptidyl-prolyl cis-trans isomerase
VLALALTGCKLKDDQPANNRPDIPAPADVAADPADAHRTASGLASKIVRVGMSNIRPSIGSNIKAHYTGWTTDGKMFDSSIGQEPIGAELRQGNLIDGWVEGLQLMVVGEKRRFWIPESLAYKGQPGNPAGMLVFDVELIGVN